jgi:hypothetical protein
MQIKLKDMPRQLAIAYAAGINVWMWSKPATGKTSIINEFVRIMRNRVPDFMEHHLYVPDCGPTDIQAAMPNTKTGFLEFFNNKSLPNRFTDPDMKGVLRLGELANGDPTVVKLLQPYVNNEVMNGVLQKPEGVFVVADSNRLQDKAGGSQQMRAMLRRFTHMDVYTDATDDLEFAARAQWHPAVQVFMKEFPQYIDNYEEVFFPPANKIGRHGVRGPAGCLHSG